MATTHQSWNAVLAALNEYGDRVVMLAPPAKPLRGVPAQQPAKWLHEKQTAAALDDEDGRCPSHRLITAVRALFAAKSRVLSAKAWARYDEKRLKIVAVVDASATGRTVPDDVPSDAPVLVLAHQPGLTAHGFRLVDPQTALIDRLTGNQ
jgi:hypothetical protein